MLSTTLLPLRTPYQKFRIIASIALLVAVVGCASKNKPVILSDSPTQSERPNSHSGELVLEETVVSASRRPNNSRGPRSKREKNSTSSKPKPVFDRAYSEAEENQYYTRDSNVPILRENNAQQIFKHYGVNPTISTNNEPFSTFAMDVDTVSYQIAKTSLESGRLPNKASIRVEEFINNFAYNYASGDDVFSISAEVVPSPYRPGFHLLHVGVKAKHVADKQRLPANLVLVADVSGSMDSQEKMGLQKQALTTLVSQLDVKDSVAIVTYSQNASVLLKPTKASNKAEIYNAIQKMHAGGGTSVELGLMQGYALADKMAYPGHLNRVVLTSDGLANIGQIDPQAILRQVKKYRERNIFLTTVGVGKSMYNDYLLEQLANRGNGNYLYLANQTDIERVFVDGLTTQLQVVAKDAKVRLKFNSEKVSLFRQIGYENRGLQTQDFLDASKDGGEVGANQQVTVLYEVKLTNLDDDVDLANIALSYKKPQGSRVFSLNKPIPSTVIRTSNDGTSPDTLISMSIAAFAEKLRQSYWSRAYSYEQIQSQLALLPVQIKSSKQVSGLLDLVSTAIQIDSRRDPYSDELPLSRISYDRVPLLR